MLDYDSKQDEKKLFSPLTGSWSGNSFLTKICNWVMRIIRYTIMRYVLSIAFVALLAFFFGYKSEDKKTAEDMANQTVNGNLFGTLAVFIKDKKPKIKITNDHPFYHLKIIKEWEEETKIKFTEIYQYITIKNEDGGKEDLLVMKDRAKKIGEEVPKKLELSTTFSFSDDAKDICKKHFGKVPTNYQRSFYKKWRHWRINKIKDELTQENDDGEKYFRCVIDSQIIKEMMPDE